MSCRHTLSVAKRDIWHIAAEIGDKFRRRFLSRAVGGIALRRLARRVHAVCTRAACAKNTKRFIDGVSRISPI